MGSYYARADGEPPRSPQAIREHYLPRGAGDALPASRTGIAVAIADRLDTLAGIFAIGEKPTGTKDPFGLRRAALGVQRILIEKRLELDLQQLIATALAGVRADIERLRAGASRGDPRRAPRQRRGAGGRGVRLPDGAPARVLPRARPRGRAASR